MTIDFTNEQLDGLRRLIERRQRELTALMSQSPERRAELGREFDSLASLQKQVDGAQFAAAVELAAEFS